MKGNCCGARTRIWERIVTTAGATRLTTSAYEFCAAPAPGGALVAGSGEESAEALGYLHATKVSSMTVRISACLMTPDTRSPLSHLHIFIARIYKPPELSLSQRPPKAQRGSMFSTRSSFVTEKRPGTPLALV
jgi:hypothetical protein